MSLHGDKESGDAPEQENALFQVEPRLVATTGEEYCCSIAETLWRKKTGEGPPNVREASHGRIARERLFDSGSEGNYFRKAEWYETSIFNKRLELEIFS